MYENKIFDTLQINQNNYYANIYKEKYIPGDSLNPGYVSSWEEYLNIPCNNNKIEKRAEKKKYRVVRTLLPVCVNFLCQSLGVPPDGSQGQWGNT